LGLRRKKGEKREGKKKEKEERKEERKGENQTQIPKEKCKFKFRGKYLEAPPRLAPPQPSKPQLRNKKVGWVGEVFN
jgi:hypothetical protein